MSAVLTIIAVLMGLQVLEIATNLFHVLKQRSE